nr:InlB B-repeat-containing protein [Bifidobacterium crudilactis]
MKLRNNEIGDYSISYVLNGGENHPSNPHAYSSNDLPISLNEPTLSGYTFDGWYQTSNFSGGKVTSIPYGSTGDKTYYAKWTYTVTYNGNSNTSGSVPSQSAATVKGSAVTLASNSGSLARTGYTFDGWNTNAAGTGSSYAVSSSQIFAGNTTLYAKWNAVTYNITYELNGVAATNSNPTTYSEASLPVSLTNLSNTTAYTFAGWYTTSNFSGSAVTAIPVGSTGDKTYYAKWTYQVSYDGNSNTSGSVPSQSVATVKGAAVTLASNSGSLARTGYTFDGWNTNAAGTGTSYAVSSSQTFAGNTTLYAKWKIATYNITYELNGGTNHASNPATYTVESLPLTLQNPTLSGFTFAGWYTEAGFVTKVTSIPVGSTGAKTFYAKWTYQVTYNANSATSGSAPAKSAATVKGAAVTLAANSGSLARTGYVFAGWNTAADGTGTSYAVSSSQTFAGNTTVYARWVAEYAITYELNGVSVTNPNPTAYSEASLPVSLTNLSNTTAYTFAGWYESSSFTGSAVTSIPAGSTGAKTFYAKWTYRVSYDKNSSTSGSAPGQSAAVIKGAAVTLAANSGSLARTGYRFAGWNTAADGTGTSYAVSSSQTLAGNTTLYARWVVAHSTAGGSFEYRIDVTNASAQVIVPANGRSSGESTYGVVYAWYVEVSDDRSSWTPLDCSAIAQTTGSCGVGVLSDSFTGTSNNSSARGPVLGTMAVGGHWIRLIPVTASDGWLRAFATYGSATHQSGTLITEVGDIPFKGLDGTVGASTTAGSFVGYAMLRGASNLQRVGKVFDSTDADWDAVTQVGTHFARYMFYGDVNIRQIGVSTSLSTGNITSVGTHFFSGTWDAAATSTSTAPGALVLPARAFDIGKIASTGTHFFYTTFRSAAKLEALPAGSFRLSTGLTTASDYFFNAFIDKANGLTQLPDGSFDTRYLTVIKTNVFYGFHQNDSAGLSKLRSLPAGSFVFHSELSSVGDSFLYRAFFNAGMLRGLPAGSFELASVETVGVGFLNQTFGGLTVAAAPKLEHSDIRRVAATWHLNQTNLNKSTVLYRTFYNVEVGGSLEESDVAQLLLNPGQDRQTFTGTRMCSASVNRANYGLLDTCTVLQRFEFEVSVSAADADTTSLVVPTNGRLNGESAFGAAYSWRIDVNDGSGWIPVDCSATPSLATGGCDGTDDTVFTGVSADSVTAGPDLGTWPEGSYWVRLRPSAATVPVGWLRAFATGGYQAASWPAHRSASWITRVRDIPFKGIDNDTNTANAGAYVGAHLLQGAVNLTEIGSVLDRTFDPDWASVSNVNAEGFLRSFASNASMLDTIPDGSLDIGGVVGTVGALFMDTALKDTAFDELPAGSFDTSGITAVGSYFMSDVVYGVSELTELPAGAFNISNIGSVGGYFFTGAFANASSLVELPAGSFRLSTGLTTPPTAFFSSTFSGASSLVELPEGSFNTEHITKVEASEFFSSAFAQAEELKRLPVGSFDISGVTKITGAQAFSRTFWHTHALTELPADSFRFNTAMTNVSAYNVFREILAYSGIVKLPAGSFNTEHIAAVGTNSFVYLFQGAKDLEELPSGSFRFGSGLTSVGGSFFFGTFIGAESLSSLPDGSFNTEHFASVGEDVFNSTFSGTALESLPDDSFRFTGLTVTHVERFLMQTFNSVDTLTTLPAGSFVLASSVTSARFFMYATFSGASKLSTVPVGSFNIQNISNVNGVSFMSSTFEGAGLTRQSIINVASSWNLSQTQLDNSGAFNNTFKDNPASGSLEDTQVTQLLLNPNTARDTFTGTRLCTASVNYANWGLSNLCDFSYFDFKIRVSAEDAAANKPVIVPTVVSSSTSYAWRISVSSNDGVTWQLQDCDGGGISYTGGGCGTGVNSVAYEGVGSATDAAAGPNLGVFAQGEYWIRLEPVVESAGWLRGFGVMKDVSSVAPSLAEWIVEVGDIPFLGLKDPAVAGDATQAGDRVGAKMFPAASNLARVGRFLHEDDPAWASVTTVGVSFLDGMFRNADSLGVAGADGSYDLSKIETVGSLFMQQAFNSTGLTSLPAGSFDTGQIRSVGSIFMNNAFAGTRLTGLPVGSFSFSAMLTAVPDQFLMNTFNGVDTLGGLPAGSFEMSYITSVGANFMNGTFTMMSAASGGSLPYEDVLRVAASWKLSQSELDKTNVLRGTFGSSQGVYAGKKLLQYQVEQLKLQPGGVATDMRYTFANTQLCTDSPFYAQYGLAECEPPHALPYTGSAAVWWWVLTVAVLLLSVPTVLARGRVLGGFAMGRMLAGVDTASGAGAGAGAGGRHARRVRLSPHEVPPRRHGE